MYTYTIEKMAQREHICTRICTRTHACPVLYMRARVHAHARPRCSIYRSNKLGIVVNFFNMAVHNLASDPPYQFNRDVLRPPA